MAASMWNNVTPSPPVVSCAYDRYEIDEEDVHGLQQALRAIRPSESSGQCLASDHFTLSRLLHKSNNQQRRWRWYQMLKRIQKCLKSLETNRLHRFVEDAVHCCQINRSETGYPIHLPSRQMLEFILIRLIGRAKLCAYVLNMAESAFVFVVQNITSGQFLAHNTLYAAIVSRVWVVMRVMVRDLIGWYDDLRPWAGRLKATAVQLIPEGETLPDSLREWMKDDYNTAEYAEAIKLTPKRKGASVLDKLFAAGSLDSAATPTPWQRASEQNNNEVSVATATPPSLDLGEPVSTEEAGGKRSKVAVKRKRSESGRQQEPGRKRSRPSPASPDDECSAEEAAVPAESRAEARSADILLSAPGSEAKERKAKRRVEGERMRLGVDQEHPGPAREGGDLEGALSAEAATGTRAPKKMKKKTSLKKMLKKQLERLAKVKSGSGGEAGRDRRTEGAHRDPKAPAEMRRPSERPRLKEKAIKPTKAGKTSIQSKAEEREGHLQRGPDKLVGVRTGNGGKVQNPSVKAESRQNRGRSDDVDDTSGRHRSRARPRTERRKASKADKPSMQSGREKGTDPPQKKPKKSASHQGENVGGAAKAFSSQKASTTEAEPQPGGGRKGLVSGPEAEPVAALRTPTTTKGKTAKTARRSSPSSREKSDVRRQKPVPREGRPVASTKKRGSKAGTPQSGVGEGGPGGWDLSRPRGRPGTPGNPHSASSLVCELGSLTDGVPVTRAESRGSDIDRIFSLLE